MTAVNRRRLITGLVSFVAGPAIVRAESIMPVKCMEPWLLPDIVEFWPVPDFVAIDLNLAMGEIVKAIGLPPSYLRRIG